MYPLSAGGLCDAVTTTPAAASSPVIDHASTGVGCDAGMDHRADTERGEHTGGVEGEDVALAARVVGDDHAALRGVRDRPGLFAVEQPLAEPGRGLADHEAVHPHRTGADRGTQPGGAELQTAGEALASTLAALVDRRSAPSRSGRRELDGEMSGSGLVRQPERRRGSDRVVSHQ